MNAEKEKIKGKKIVISKKDHQKNIDEIEKDIKMLNKQIDENNKEILEILSMISSVLLKILKEPEQIMYPIEESKKEKDIIFNQLHVKDKNIEFSVSNEEDYLYELEKDLQRAKVYLDRYETKKDSNKKSSVAYLCANMGITSISESTIDALIEEKNRKEPIKAADIAKRINESRVNLYLREQKERAQSEASQAKSEILGAVLNHIDLDETKTDIFAAL